jgi:hypothetical protein
MFKPFAVAAMTLLVSLPSAASAKAAKPAKPGASKYSVTSGGWTITASAKSGTAKSAAGKQVVLWTPAKAEKGCTDERSGKLLSAVGALVSFQKDGNGYCEGAAHPWANSSFATVDLRTGKPVSLYDLFAKAEVDAAMAADAFLKKAKDDPEADCKFTLADFDKSFAFVDLQGDRVGVRIGLTHGCEAARGNLTQIGVLLKPSAALLADLQAANAGKTLYKHLGKR